MVDGHELLHAGWWLAVHTNQIFKFLHDTRKSVARGIPKYSDKCVRAGRRAKRVYEKDGSGTRRI
jgi:hypothetical protein